ncbi:uncharacterized protein LOC119097752, partial [Pollicipes pollicipes]|uniref:uncharacterized protein LOC119097749 n=1 Tax=Pollicipes pollicipes TaxID=41117 RepID=UPI00188534D7
SLQPLPLRPGSFPPSALQQPPPPGADQLLAWLLSDLAQASRRASGAAISAPPGAGPLTPAKRQIRYHQCYFNPISCFRRRK